MRVPSTPVVGRIGCWNLNRNGGAVDGSYSIASPSAQIHFDIYSARVTIRTVTINEIINGRTDTLLIVNGRHSNFCAKITLFSIYQYLKY